MLQAVEASGQCLRNLFAWAQPRRRRRWISALAVLVGAIVTARAASAQALNLESAIRGALRNDNIAVQLQNETVNAAAGRVKQAAGQFDWNANAQAGWQLFYVGKAGPNGVLTDQVTAVSTYYYSAGVGREFRNGISIAPGFIGYAGASSALTGGLTKTRPVLGLKVPLLRGLGEDSVDATEQAAQANLIGAKLGRNFAIARLVENVAQIYWRCIADDKALQYALSAERTAVDYEATMEKMSKRGLIEPRAVKQNMISDVSHHLDASSASQASQKCYRDLAYATTGSISAPLPTVAGELPAVANMADAVNHLNISALIQMAQDNRPDLKAAQKSVEAASDLLNNAHDNTRPDLSLHVDPDHALVTYTQSLQNNLAEGQEETAIATRNQAQLTLQQMRDQVKADVTDAVRNLQQVVLSWSTLNNAEREQETVVAEGKRMAQFGAISWQDYGGSLSQLLSLQQQVVNAQLQFAVGLGALRLATGSIEMESETPASIATKLATLPAALVAR